MSDEKPKRPPYELAVTNARPMFLQIEQGDESRWNKELVFALQIIRGNDVLQKCTSDSIMNSIVNLATIGISLNPALALAYLVPRDGRCVLDLSYRGLIKIGTDSGSIRSIHANVVYSFDEFDYEEGTEQRIHHKRSMNPPPEFIADPLAQFWKFFVCAYSVATLFDGNKDYMIMPKYKIEKIRNTSKVKSDKGPWGQWPEEMSRKTVIKYHYKTLPQSEKISQAVAILNEHEGLADRQTHASNIMSRFTDAEEVPEVKPGATAAAETLQTAYKVIQGLSDITGETPDDCLSRLSGDKCSCLIDLEEKKTAYVNDIIIRAQNEIQAEIAKGVK